MAAQPFFFFLNLAAWKGDKKGGKISRAGPGAGGGGSIPCAGATGSPLSVPVLGAQQPPHSQEAQLQGKTGSAPAALASSMLCANRTAREFRCQKLERVSTEHVCTERGFPEAYCLARFGGVFTKMAP